jgi:hypothetical protein
MKFLTERTKTDALTNAEIMRKFYARFLSIRSLEVRHDPNHSLHSRLTVTPDMHMLLL